MNFPFLGNGGGKYLVIFNSGVRVRFSAEIIAGQPPANLLLLFQGEQQVGSIDPNQVAAMFDMDAIEEFPPPERC